MGEVCLYPRDSYLKTRIRRDVHPTKGRGVRLRRYYGASR
nr:MAG TPA: hypothetical protein [Microviridae sp.]